MSFWTTRDRPAGEIIEADEVEPGIERFTVTKPSGEVRVAYNPGGPHLYTTLEAARRERYRRDRRGIG